MVVPARAAGGEFLHFFPIRPRVGVFLVIRCRSTVGRARRPAATDVASRPALFCPNGVAVILTTRIHRAVELPVFPGRVHLARSSAGVNSTSLR